MQSEAQIQSPAQGRDETPVRSENSRPVKSGKVAMFRKIRKIRAYLNAQQGLIFPVLDVALNLLNYGFHVFSGRILNTGQYGKLNALLGYVIILTIMGISLQSHCARNTAAHSLPGSGRQWLPMPSFPRFLLPFTLILILLQQPVASWFRATRMEMLLISAIFPAHLLLSFYRGYFQGCRHFFSLSMSFYIETLVKISLLTLLLPRFPNVTVPLLAILGAYAAALIHALLRLWRVVGSDRIFHLSPLRARKGSIFRLFSRNGRLSQPMPPPRAGRALAFGSLSKENKTFLSILMANTALYLFTSLDMVIVNIRFPLVSAQYAVVTKFGMLLFYAGSSFMTVILPHLSGGSDTRTRLKKYYLSLIFIIISGLVGWLSYISWIPRLVVPVFGEAYAEAARLIPMGGTAFVMLYLVQFASTSLIATQNTLFPWLNLLGVGLITTWITMAASTLQSIFAFQGLIYGLLAIALIIINKKELRKSPSGLTGAKCQ